VNSCPSALIAEACTHTVNTCLKLAVPPMAALKIAKTMPEKRTAMIGAITSMLTPVM